MTPKEALIGLIGKVLLNMKRGSGVPGDSVLGAGAEAREALKNLRSEHCQDHAMAFLDPDPGKFGLRSEDLLEIDKKFFPRGIPREKKY